MKSYPTNFLKSILIGSIICFGNCIVAGQEFEIEGESDIICGEYYQYYLSIEQIQLINIVWEIFPSAGTIQQVGEVTVYVACYTPGNYSIIAHGWTSDSTLISDTLQVTVFQIIPPLEMEGCFAFNDVIECYQVCELSHTMLYDQFQGGEVWITGAINYDFDPNGINIDWGEAGDGSINILGPNCNYEYCFEILPIPDVNFRTTPIATNDTLRICKNEEIFFENTTINGVEFLWKFGDGNESTSFNITHSYKKEGIYTILLNATSFYCECESEKQLIVEVLPSPAPELDCVNSICAETRQKYTAATDGCSEFNWTVSSNGTVVNGGGPNDDFIEVIWHEGPDGIIELTVDDCATTYCSSSKTFRIPIITTDGPITGDQTVCPAEIVVYEAPYFPGVTYSWSIGPEGVIVNDQNSNAISVRWNDVNISTNTFVSVEYDNCFLECSGSHTLGVVINPKIKISGDQQVCQHGTATIEATAGFTSSVPANVNWHIEDENGNVLFTSGIISSAFNHTFSYPAGEYSWVATNTSSGFCNERISQKITVTATPPAPLGIIGEDRICPSIAYGYSIESAGNYATIWTVTDGATQHTYKGQSIQHTFGSTPPFEIIAFHADLQYPDCKSDPITKIIQSVSPLTITGPDEVCFNGIDSFSTDYVKGVDYSWEIIPADHGEIQRTDLNKISVFWTQPGTATIRVHACGGSFDKIVDVRDLPAFNIVGPMEACQGEKVLLSTDQPSLTHRWFDETNSTISSGNNFEFYPGSYGLAARDAIGCSSEKLFQITTLPLPVINISTTAPQIFCNTIPPGVEIVANTDGSNYTFEWFKNGVSVGPGGAKYIVTDFGTYYAVATNQYGCKAKSTEILFEDCCVPTDCIIVLPGCVGGCDYIEKDFDVLVTGTECQTHQYTPLWPDIIPDKTIWGIYSRSQGTLAVIAEDVLNYTYSSPGYYDIVLVALIDGFVYTPSICGHRQELKDTIRAVANFTFAGQCAGELIAFEDLTTFLPDESIAKWHWDFNDPSSGADNISNLQNPVHSFSAAGDYSVQLTVTMASGCTTTKSLSIHITAGDPLTPVYSPVYCANEAMSFTIPEGFHNIQWDFGDPLSGIENTAQSDTSFHTFTSSAIYNITVSATDVAKCKSESSFNVDVRANTLAGTIDIDPASSLCYGDTAILTSSPGGVSWQWSNGDITEQIIVDASSQYNLLVTDQYHCTYSPPAVFIDVNPVPEIIVRAREIFAPEEFGPWLDSLKICAGSEFEVQVFSAQTNNYIWQDGGTGNHLVFTLEGGNMPVAGSHTYSVVAYNIVTNCASPEHTINVEIISPPTKPIAALIAGSGCGHNENTIEVTNVEPGILYTWSDEQTGNSILTSNAGVYSVIAANEHGCFEKSNNVIIKHSAPVDQLPAGCYTACDPLNVCLPSIDNLLGFSIFKDGVLLLNGSAWPDDLLITEDGAYTFELTNWNGCVATSDPLDISLYQGVGNITVLTYFDTDGNGLIAPPDVLLPNIPVEVISADGLHSGGTYTNDNGEFVFEDYPSLFYTASFNQDLLSSEWKIIIDSVQGEIKTCNDSIVVALLLQQNCSVQGPTVKFEICPGETVVYGDSTWTDVGIYVVHEFNSSGCDSIFEVEITNPDSITINPLVWVDVDRNGVLSSADTLLNNTTIYLVNQLTSEQFTFLSGTSPTVSDATYSIEIDTLNLTGGLIALYWNDVVDDSICGETAFNFLVAPTCAPVFVIQQEFICEGDSLLIQDTLVHEEGVYSFSISETGSFCDTTLDVYVRFHPPLFLESATSWNCTDMGTIIAQPAGVSPFVYAWSNTNATDSILTHLDDGVYSVTVTDANGCSNSSEVSIASIPLLEFSIDPYYEITFGDTLSIQISGDTLNSNIYQWLPANEISCSNCASLLAFPNDNVTLTIEITDSLQCHYYLQTNIVVNPPEPMDTIIADAVYVPNVFSPNGDNTNEIFSIYSRLPDVHLQELTIMDRWGELVFLQE